MGFISTPHFVLHIKITYIFTKLIHHDSWAEFDVCHKNFICAIMYGCVKEFDSFLGK